MSNPDDEGKPFKAFSDFGLGPGLSTDRQHQAILYQILDHLNLGFEKCKTCDGSGEGLTWIPVCQVCYGLGNIVKENNEEI